MRCMSRVERWRGGLGVAYRLSRPFVCGCLTSSPCSVSTSRSSNRACGFLAHGSPTGFSTSTRGVVAFQS